MNKHWRSRLLERLFSSLCLLAGIIPLLVLMILISSLFYEALPRFSLDFLMESASRIPEKAGVFPAMIGSIFLVVLTAIIALPVGVASALYLEEYGNKGKIAHLIEVNVANLAGVPSVIYGLLGLEIFVRFLGFGKGLLSGALTLSLLILPIVITASRESLRNIDRHYREASLALGATKWQTLWRIILPLALPGVLTGSILAISRAIGETAPLLVVGAAAYVAFVPDGITSDYTALPIQILSWITRPQEGFATNAAAAIVVLLAILLFLNGIVLVLRNRYGKHRVA